MAESERKIHMKNGRKVCKEPLMALSLTAIKRWSIWYNRMEDTRREGTVNARYYDK